MTISDFFKDDILELPKTRNDDDFERFIDGAFRAFLALVPKLSGTDPITTAVISAQPAMTQLCEELRKAIASYFDGFPHGAYAHLEAGIAAIRPHLDSLSDHTATDQGIRCLYRARLGSLQKFDRKGLFHVPFESRHKVTTKRYSISGLPSLYLGGSLWVCWEELGRPDFDSMHVAEFQVPVNRTIQFLDFGFRPGHTAIVVEKQWQKIVADPDSLRFFVGQAICWPLIAACSIKVKNAGEPFVPEYVIPQLLLQWLRNSTSWDGLRYFTTRVTEYVDNAEVLMNYVFPARQKAPTGYCATLKQKFTLSDPIAWSMLTQADLPIWHVRNPNWFLSLAEGVTVLYTNTRFWNCEGKLALFPDGII